MRLYLLLIVFLAGCADLSSLQRDHQAMTRTLTQAQEHPRAMKCAPRELAMAQAHAAFAQVEFDQGDADRAAVHVHIARQNAQEALQLARACAPVDSDKDGIVDEKDLCPDEAEDADGYEDGDGCPEPGPVTAEPEPEPEPEPQPEPRVGDQDADGVADQEDQCPATAEDLDGFKDADGCPELDNDGDGVADIADSCPMAPEDFDSFEDDDGCPDPDNDADGILDELDECPGEKEDFDGDADGDGCPDLDEDGDGIADGEDECPAEAEVFNNYLDQDGCPDTKPQRVEITKKQIVIKEQIKFESGKSTIRSSSYPIIDDVVQVMKDYPDIRVRIEGHTDNQGDDLFNLRLSKARADAVFEYMILKGLQASRLETVGFGETRPIDTNRTPEGRQKNRRVEFHIVEGM